MAVVVAAVLRFVALFVGLHKDVTQPTQLAGYIDDMVVARIIELPSNPISLFSLEGR